MQYRQGDILFIKLNENPSGELIPRDQHNRIVVAEGEVTGHAHAIHEENVTFYRDDILNGAWIVVDDTADVVHEEHDTIPLDSGTWAVVYQRQYVRGQVRRVLD